MKSRCLSSLCVTTALCVLTASAADAEDNGQLAERTFRFLDKNSDGQLDAAEFAKTPITIREWLANHSHKPNPTLKKAEFTQVFDRMMADLRKPKPEEPETTKGNGTGNGASSGSVASNGSASLYASGKEPLEVASSASPTDRLPGEYQPGDENRDGQIDFAEWRKWKGGELAKFRELDANKDFVLSPRELGASEVQVARTKSKLTSSKPVVIVAYDELSDDLKKKFGEVIKTAYFDYLDEDKSGKLEPKEWEASSRISKAFSEAKVDLSKDMDSATFVAHYSKIVGTKDTGVWKDYLEKNPPPESKSGTGDATASKEPSKTGSTSGGGDSYDKLSDSRKKEYREIVKGYFNYLDGKGTADFPGSEKGNKDGKLQENEWDGSSRIKPVFVNAKIDLKKPMSEAEFITHYTKLVGTKDPTWQRKNPSRGDKKDRKVRGDRKDRKDRKRRR